jgi:imidazolonepropionase-like amidohydrolase
MTWSWWAEPEPLLWQQLQDRGSAAIETPTAPDSARIVLRGTVMSAVGPALANAHVAMEDGRITAVGAGDGPDAGDVWQGEGWFITPGLIDTHSHLGVYPSPSLRAHSDGNEMTSPTTPGVWAEHSVWPRDPGFQRAVAGGVTALQILPGSANLIGGRGVIMRPIPTRGSRAMRFPGAPETVKMACGENPKRVYGKSSGPSTRMGNVEGYRQAFIDAQEYERSWRAYDEALAAYREGSKARGRRAQHADPPDAPHRDLANDTLIGILRGAILPHVHCYRADDMLAFLQVADEFGFQIRSFHHAVESYKIRDILAEQDVSVSTWSDWWGFKAEAYDAVLPNASMVADAGARSIIHSDSAIGIQRLNQEASKAWHDGIEAGFVLSEEEALSWITLNAAWALGIDHETGSLESGKRADVVVWDGHPFSVYSRPVYVFIDGVLWYDATQPSTWSDFEIGQEKAQ